MSQIQADQPTNGLEVRMAKLEGSYEQIDKRLAHLETRIDGGFDNVDRKIDGLRNLIFTLFGALSGLVLLIVSLFGFFGRGTS